ncbi:MAG: flagellar FlbD family protein [Desulfobacterales bacterium]|jgi:flagellar protein FlbD
MIKVTRLNDSVLMVNVDRIQSLQAIPETVITFTNNDKIMVKEPLEEVSQRIVEYQRAIKANPVSGASRSTDLS